MSVLQDRNYVRLEKRALIPEDRGRIVTAFLESFFTRYVEYGFTADLEEKLDQISAGELDVEGRAARLLDRLHASRPTRSRICASPRCSTRSTSCSPTTSSRPRPTAPIRAAARPAAPARCR